MLCVGNRPAKRLFIQLKGMINADAIEANLILLCFTIVQTHYLRIRLVKVIDIVFVDQKSYCKIVICIKCSI